MNIYACLIAALLIILVHGTCYAENYKYVEYFPPHGTDLSVDKIPTIISRSGYVHMGGHYPAEYCEDHDIYNCIQSSPLDFVVPKGKLYLDQHWSYNGDSYTVTQHYEDFALMGESSEAFMIESELDDEHVRQFLFSPCRGLIAFGVVSLRTNQLNFVSWLTEECGLFAHQECRG